MTRFNWLKELNITYHLVGIFIFVTFLLPSTVSASAEEYPAGSGNWYPGSYNKPSLAVEDVQDAINAAKGAKNWKNGDTVHLPPGSATWAKHVTVSKGITIKGAGKTRTQISRVQNGSNWLFTFSTTSGWRLTGIHLIWPDLGPDRNNQYMNFVYKSFQGVRIDNCYFENKFEGELSARALEIKVNGSDGPPSGVIDSNDFKNCSVMLKDASTHCNNPLMALPSRLGSDINLFFEDNHTWRTKGRRNFIDTEGGHSYVARFNTIEDTYALIHPARNNDKNCPRRGGRNWEFYGNKWTLTGVADMRNITIESGTGVVFDNIMKNYKSGIQVFLQNRNGYPRYGACDGNSKADGNMSGTNSPAGYWCRDQIGRATDEFTWESKTGPIPKQKLEPAYFWNNTARVNVPSLDQAWVVQGRDYYEDDNSHMKKGARADRPASCKNNDGYWATDKGGDWNSKNNKSNDGALYTCKNNLWEFYYEPYTYPHPLTEWRIQSSRK